MRAEFRAQLPSTLLLEGTAENLPFDDGSIDLITVAQAFHWFDHDRALFEFNRVLVSGGGLCLIWNERDESVPWVKQLSHAIMWDTRRPYDMSSNFIPLLEGGGFVQVDKREFVNAQLVDLEGLHQRVLSTSYLAVMAPEEQKRILDKVDVLIDGFDEFFELPYVTTMYCATRV